MKRISMMSIVVVLAIHACYAEEKGVPTVEEVKNVFTEERLFGKQNPDTEYLDQEVENTLYRLWLLEKSRYVDVVEQERAVAAAVLRRSVCPDILKYPYYGRHVRLLSKVAGLRYVRGTKEEVSALIDRLDEYRYEEIDEKTVWEEARRDQSSMSEMKVFNSAAIHARSRIILAKGRNRRMRKARVDVAIALLSDLRGADSSRWESDLRVQMLRKRFSAEEMIDVRNSVCHMPGQAVIRGREDVAERQQY